jgi:hypothetical protein
MQENNLPRPIFVILKAHHKGQTLRKIITYLKRYGQTDELIIFHHQEKKQLQPE